MLTARHRENQKKMPCPPVCLFRWYLRVVVSRAVRHILNSWSAKAFDETRLPLPMTAIYAEMRAAARKALVGSLPRVCVIVYAVVLRTDRV